MSVQQPDLALPAEAPRRGMMSERAMINLLRLALLAALLAFWQFASGPLIPAFFVSSPSAIFARLSTWLMNGQLFFHMGITAAEAALGFLSHHDLR